jgi:uncharacterized OsmC-like protein
MAERKINGLDVEALGRTIAGVREDPELGAFEFRTRTRWLEGGNNRTTITSFHGVGQENDERRFVVEADEPSVLLGRDRAPNPVEYLLEALASCLTSAMVYQAAARGIVIDECECELRGELDVRGFLGLSPDARKGYRRIEARFRVKSTGTAEELEECARFSPVLDVVSNGTEVALEIERRPTMKAEAERAPAP